MKRGLLILLFSALVLLPTVSATISITGPSKLHYNIGEQIAISGYAQETEAFSGQLQFSLLCGSKVYKFQQVNIELSANEKKDFSELTLPTITASSSMEGTCKIKGDLVANTVIEETAYSSSFEITRDLDGSFTVDQSQIQLGDTITITGTINSLDGTPLEGTAELYFEYQGVEYLIDFVTVEDGFLSYSYPFTSGTAGTYKIDSIVRDSYGNEQEFEDVDSFTVLDTLQVTLNTNAQSFYPGDVVNVFGDVKTTLQDYVLTATIELGLDDATQSTALEDSKYTQDISIPTTITSGQHTITVTIKDTYGNSGSASLPIEVKPKATLIENRINNGTLNPEDQVSIGVTLYDQAGDVMVDYVLLEVYDTNNRLVSERELASEETITYKIPQFAPPGEWIVKSSYRNEETQEEVTTSDAISINTVQELAFEIVEDIVYITNVGNVKYTEDVEITVSGVDQDYLIKKTKNLGVNETIVIDLAQELPTGTYTVSIPTGFNTAEQGQVSIEDGKIKTSLTWPYTILALAFIVGLAYVIYARVRPAKKEKKEEFKPAQKTKIKKIRLYDPKREAEKTKKADITFTDKEQSIQDFKQRTLEEIRRTEEKIQKDSRRTASLSEGKLGYVTGRNDPVARSKPTQEKPSVFNLFDE